MTAAVMARADARNVARSRMAEVLEMVVPGFGPERPFRCLAPGHEDRHPSMRFLSRSNTVRCFSCQWHGAVFDVVGAVYGLDGGDKFRKTYDLLSIDARGGRAAGYSRPAKPAAPKHEPGSVKDLLSIIYPPGWNDPEPEIKLPMPLQVVVKAETGVAGRMSRHSDAVEIAVECGLMGWHFDDSVLGAFYDVLRQNMPTSNYSPEFLELLAEQAVPAHMMRKLCRFIVSEGQRRKLEASFALAYSHHQNGEPSSEVLKGLLQDAERVTGNCYAVNEDYRISDLFERYNGNENPVTILNGLLVQNAISN